VGGLVDCVRRAGVSLAVSRAPAAACDVRAGRRSAGSARGARRWDGCGTARAERR
jgi:hypothetical protein